jgi:hypothetical protein
MRFLCRLESIRNRWAKVTTRNKKIATNAGETKPSLTHAQCIQLLTFLGICHISVWHI